MRGVLTMTDDSYTGDDRLSKPPAGAVLVQRIGSWAILYSHEEKNIYIVSTDYHPEPFRISLQQLEALQTALAERQMIDSAPTMSKKQSQKKSSDE
jgi:hypothetical protein